MKSADLEKIHNAFSFSVSFTNADFLAWVRSNENADEYRISFGIYPDQQEEPMKAGSEGRLTAFVWSIVDGQEGTAYNMGDLKP